MTLSRVNVYEEGYSDLELVIWAYVSDERYVKKENWATSHCVSQTKIKNDQQ
jgi:hypothetical protein